jgi:hypothetical protein
MIKYEANMPRYRRVALFLDYENLHNTLQKRTSTIEHRFGYSPHLDFKQLVAYIEAEYGPLHKRDFIVVANFTHYDEQKGGLNQVATLIHADSFESRAFRQEHQPAPGKKYVVRNFADTRLAYEIGHHIALRPADLYLIGSNDAALAAVGQALIQAEIPVVFLLPEPDKAAIILKENFDYFAFDSTQALNEPEPETKTDTPPRTEIDPAEELASIISELRQSLSTPVPISLIEVLYGSEQGLKLLERAQSQGLVDLWQDENGVSCVTRRTERLFDVIQKYPVRAGVTTRAQLLLSVRRIAERGLLDPTGATWRRSLKDEARISSNESKMLFNQLLNAKILRVGFMSQPVLNLETINRFMTA